MDGHTSASNDVIELHIVLALILLNGVFALSELAVVSARVPRLRALAATSHSGAASALALATDPGRFLSAVQNGITLIGIINGAYSGEAFGEQASAFFRELGLSPAAANVVGYGIVIVVITYLSVIIGELVPKNFALRNAERIACRVAPFMTAFARAAKPAVWLLDASTRLVFRIIGQTTKSARNEFYYFNDDAELVAMRYDQLLPGATTPTAWKLVFCEQRAPGSLQIWKEPFTCMRAPKYFNLRMDPYERADTGPTAQYHELESQNPYVFIDAQRRAGAFLQTFIDYPPSQIPASFTIDQIEADVKRQVREKMKK